MAGDKKKKKKKPMVCYRGFDDAGKVGTSHQNRKEFFARTSADNAAMAKRLKKIYNVNKESFLVKNGLGKGHDCNPGWKIRTTLYEETRKWRKTGRDGGKGPPKTLALVICSGCGRKTFFQADGPKTKRCPLTHLWYCSELCRKVDFEPYGRIQAERISTNHNKMKMGRANYWVINGTAKWARDNLLRYHKLKKDVKKREKKYGSEEQFMKTIKDMRKKELKADGIPAEECLDHDPTDPNIKDVPDVDKLEQILFENVRGKNKSVRDGIRKSFKYFDKDGSGNIDFSEFLMGVDPFLIGVESSRIRTLFDRYDADQGGTISLGEFSSRLCAREDLDCSDCPKLPPPPPRQPGPMDRDDTKKPKKTRPRTPNPWDKDQTKKINPKKIRPREDNHLF